MRHSHGHSGNTAHLAHCEPTLELMESIAETIPDAVFHARKEAYEQALRDAQGHGFLTHTQRVLLEAHSPYAPVPPAWTGTAGGEW